MKRILTRKEYLTLRGLQALGKRLSDQLDELERTAGEIIEDEDWGPDLVSGYRDLDEWIRTNQVEVLE